jgi:hypothetical protein
MSVGPVLLKAVPLVWLRRLAIHSLADMLMGGRDIRSIRLIGGGIVIRRAHLRAMLVTRRGKLGEHAAIRAVTATIIRVRDESPLRSNPRSDYAAGVFYRIAKKD